MENSGQLLVLRIGKDNVVLVWSPKCPRSCVDVHAMRETVLCAEDLFPVEPDPLLTEVTLLIRAHVLDQCIEGY
jgi:hypothetical protein